MPDEEEDYSPKPAKKQNGTSTNGKPQKKGIYLSFYILFIYSFISLFTILILDDDVLSSQASSQASQSSQDAAPSSAAATITTDDGDVIVTQFKDNPKLRKQFQRKLNKMLDDRENMNAPPDPTVNVASAKPGKKSNLTPLEQQFIAIKKEYLIVMLLSSVFIICVLHLSILPTLSPHPITYYPPFYV